MEGSGHEYFVMPVVSPNHTLSDLRRHTGVLLVSRETLPSLRFVKHFIEILPATQELGSSTLRVNIHSEPPPKWTFRVLVLPLQLSLKKKMEFKTNKQKRLERKHVVSGYEGARFWTRG